MDKRTLLFMICVSLTFFGVNAFYDWYSPTPKPAPVAAQPIVKKEIVIAPVTSTPVSSSGETFYVLENDYQQLVFSNLGGSLAEINLPLRKTSSKSYVKEIGFDQTIAEKSPQNARFPLYASKTVDGKESEGNVGGYYPLLRRGINGKHLAPEYYALNFVSTDPNVANTRFEMTRFESNLIQFQGTVNGSRVVKTYTIPAERNGPYCFQLDIQIDGSPNDVWLSSGVPEAEIVSNAYTPNLRIQTTGKNNVAEVDTVDLPKKGTIGQGNVTPNWISNSNGFLGVIISPEDQMNPGYKTVQIDGNSIPTRLTLVDPGYNPYPAADYPGYATYLPVKSGKTAFRVFAGPYDNALLAELDELYEDPTKNYNPEYTSALSIQGWFSFISQPFVKFLSFLMGIFYSITHSWAASIILLTIALKAMMFPLNNWSIVSSIKMQQIAPKVKAVQDRYKNDPRKAQMEVMNLYRESGVNPLMGCLPVLLQMPFLMGMFYLLKSSFPLRGASFIPGWINDLSAPDVLFTWGQPVWFFGNEFHLLPILMGLTMYLQQRFTAKLPKDPSKLSDSQKQQKMMGNMMAVLFTVMFYNFPSGLNIYFMLSTLLGLAQQAWMTKRMQANPQKV